LSGPYEQFFDKLEAESAHADLAGPMSSNWIAPGILPCWISRRPFIHPFSIGENQKTGPIAPNTV
jgi:hypothetical protein